MIFDRLEHREKYYSLHPLFKAAFNGLSENAACTPGIRYYSQSYLTRPEGEIFESHKKFIDIQVLLEGEERIYVSPSDSLTEIEPYEEKNDTVFYNFNPDGKFSDLCRGDFIILFPGEAHCPCVSAGKISNVRKTVIKVPYFPEN